MIGSDRKIDKSEYDMDRLAQSSYGCSDEQLWDWMNMAMEEISDDQLPPESEQGFERLSAERERRGLKSRLENDGSSKTDWTINDDIKEEGKKKPLHIGLLLRVALPVAILGSVLVGTGLTAGARKSYEYKTNSRVEVIQNVVIKNEVGIADADALEQAYVNIQNAIGIKVLQLGEKPANLTYLKTAVNNRRATMYFDYKGESFYVMQKISSSGSSATVLSERQDGESVYNAWLDKEIILEASQMDNGLIEYSAYFEEENAYYYLAGAMEKEVFVNTIKNLNYFIR